MRRIAASLVVARPRSALVVCSAPAPAATSGAYEVRAIFDNGGFLVPGEEVRIAGAKVGAIDRGRRHRRRRGRPRRRQPRARQGRGRAAHRRPGFQDFREDASCIIRPQSLLGEKFVECQPDRSRARPGSEPPPALEADPRRRARRGPVPAAAGAERQGRRPRPRQQHHAGALSGPLPADPQRPRRRLRRARRGPRGARSSAPTRRCGRPTRCWRSSRSRTASWPSSRATPTRRSARWPREREHDRRLHQQRRTSPAEATAERRADLEAQLPEAPRLPGRAAGDDDRARPLRRRSSTPVVSDLGDAAPVADPDDRGARPVLARRHARR